MKKWIIQWKYFMMICTIVAIFLGENQKVYAADHAVLQVEGVMETDVVILYKIASYDESSQTYQWTEPVTTWVSEKNTMYKDLTPKRFIGLTEQRALEFCSLLLTGLQTSAAGVTPDVEETGETEYEIKLSPGIYIILPIGSTRVYSLKWIEAPPKSVVGNVIDIQYIGADQISDMTDEELDMDYDYELPQIEVQVENLIEERNYRTEEGQPEETLPEEQQSDEDSEEPPEENEGEVPQEQKNVSIFAIKDDQVQVTAKVLVPTYPSIYAMEKRITNIYVAIPQGIQYIQDSLELTHPVENEESHEIEETEISPEKYGKQSLQDATVYEYNGQQIFFKVDEWYYNLDGSTLITDAEDAEAFRTYLKEKGLLKEESLDETEDSDDSNTDPSVDDLVITNHWTIFIFSFETDEEWKEVNVSYRVTKNDESNQTGIYPLKTALLYSISPLNTSLRGYTEGTAEIDSFGINITVVKGTSFSDYTSIEDLLDKEEKFRNVVFGVYRFTGKRLTEIDKENLIPEGDLQIHNGEKSAADSEEDSSQENEDMSDDLERVVYKLHKDGTYHEYELMKIVSPNEDGVIRLGGLSKEEYLIRQTKFPVGFSYAAETFLINKEDWDEESLMEGNNVAALVWLNFPTAYLPATGKEGIGKYVTVGVMIGMLALTGMMIMLIKEVKSLKKMIQEREQYLKQQEINNNSNETEKGEIL